MTRIRTIKPGFWKSEDVSVLSFRTRLTWVGLWTHCDDHGRTKDVSRLIKGDLWSLDEVTLKDIEDDLSALSLHGRIVRYIVDDKRYLAVVNWHLHQAISHPGKPRFPAPPVPVGPTDPSDDGYCSVCAPTPHGTLTAPSRAFPEPSRAFPPGREGKGKEGRGRGRETPVGTLTAGSPQAEPPRRCPTHEQTRSSQPCGACGDARRDHESWVRAQKPKPMPQPETPTCPLHPDQPTGSKTCPRCAAEAKPAPNLRQLIAGAGGKATS